MFVKRFKPTIPGDQNLDATVPTLNSSVPESTVFTGDEALGRASARQRRRVKTRPTKHHSVHRVLLVSNVWPPAGPARGITKITKSK
jgi:hypothetical protein